MLTNIKLKLKNTRITKNPSIIFDSEKLKETELAEELQAQIGCKFLAQNILDSDIDTITKVCSY